MRSVHPGKPGHIRPSSGSGGPSPGSSRNSGHKPQRKHPVEIWRECHAMLDAITPLSSDCGTLCGARCCKGGPQDGMLLFPEEALLFEELITTVAAFPGSPSEMAEPIHGKAETGVSEAETGDWRLEESQIVLPGTSGPLKLLVCNGRCSRNFRPMACRMFPLLPWMDRHGRIRVRPDLRAYALCPLLSDPASPPISATFAEAVRSAFELASVLPGTRLLLESLNTEASLLRKFFGLDSGSP